MDVPVSPGSVYRLTRLSRGWFCWARSFSRGCSQRDAGTSWRLSLASGKAGPHPWGAGHLSASPPHALACMVSPAGSWTTSMTTERPQASITPVLRTPVKYRCRPLLVQAARCSAQVGEARREWPAEGGCWGPSLEQSSHG